MSFLTNWKEFDRRIYKKGGGGSSGTVDYPPYMKTFHGELLDDSGVDTVTTSLMTVINTAVAGNSPFFGEVAFDPDTDIAVWETAITGFDALVNAITETTDWAALFTQAEASIPDITAGIITEATIVADGVAFADQLDDQITTITLPRFQSGMRDINAVVSSAFVVGEALIEGFRDRDVAKHDSAIRLTAVTKNAELAFRSEEMVTGARINASSQLLRFLIQKYAWEESLVRMTVESRRIKIVAKSEEADTQVTLDEADANWDLEVFQHGANLLAGIGGGVASSKKKKTPKTASAIGGGMAGAATGALVGSEIGSIGGGWGALIGAVIGAAAGYYSAEE